MSFWLRYDDKNPINLDHVISFYKEESEIIFNTVCGSEKWTFGSKSGCSVIHFEIENYLDGMETQGGGFTIK
jgi:hypothetical protein